MLAIDEMEMSDMEATASKLSSKRDAQNLSNQVQLAAVVALEDLFTLEAVDLLLVMVVHNVELDSQHSSNTNQTS